MGDENKALSGRAASIQAVKNPIGFFVLAFLVVEAVMGGLASSTTLGIGEEELAVYISTGGGGYMYADKQIGSIVRSLSGMRNLRLMIVPGPLYSGAVVDCENTIWCEPRMASNAMAAADLAISAAGYNSFYELMACHIPTIFIPLVSNADDQYARALRAVRAGAAQVLPMTFDDDALRNAVVRWQDDLTRSKAVLATNRIMSANCAGVAVAELWAMLT